MRAHVKILLHFCALENRGDRPRGGFPAKEEPDLRSLLAAQITRGRPARSPRSKAPGTRYAPYSPPPMARDAPNPYRKESCPDLYAAWDEGYQAYLAGESVPTEHLERPSAASNAWLNGYTAARLSSPDGAHPGAASSD